MKSSELATFGGGCFWCVEAAFEQLEGVEKVLSGYAGGKTEDPSYRDVCAGNTDHAEVVRVTFDSSIIGYRDLLEVFFTVHDPTQLNRQGPDIGPQYRSIILYHDDEQKSRAKDYIDELENSGRYSDPIVTELEPLDGFYPAEEHHQDYFANHPDQAYCRRMIPPKLEKLRDAHADKLVRESFD